MIDPLPPTDDSPSASSPAEAVVVTGIGWVTPLGIGRDLVWQHLLNGISAIRPVHSFDTTPYPVELGGEVPEFDFSSFAARTESSVRGRASQFAVAAALLALDDAGLPRDVAQRTPSGGGISPHRAGVVFGTTSGEPNHVEIFNDHRIEERPSAIDDALARHYPCHVIPGQVAAEVGFAGPNLMIPAACAAGNYAVAQAFDLLRSGRTDLMLAGGADAFSRITYAGFARLGAIAKARCQPFDRQRQGMVPGEGGAVLVLETADSAKRRGARIYAEIAGCGLSCDAHHMTAAHPEGAGAARAMSRALDQAGLEPAAIDYVSAHGTGTPTNDRLETIALQRVFGAGAERVPVSSIKSMIGHTMGAASAIESGVCALAVSRGEIPPTINFEEPDPECALDCVPNEGRQLTVTHALNNAYAFGGNNASVIFRQYSTG